MKKTIFLSLVVALMAVGISGCVDNDRSLAIMWVLQPDVGEECKVSSVGGDDQEGALFGGSLDVAYPGYGGEPFYMMSIQVHNNLSAEPEVCESCETNNHDIQLERMEVNYSFEKGREIVEGLAPSLLLLEDQQETLPVGGSLEAESINLVMGIPVINQQVGALLYSLGEEADQVVLGISIRLIGTTLGGERVESSDFLFPIYLCWGCLSAAVCEDGSYPGCYPGQELDGCPDA